MNLIEAVYYEKDDFIVFHPDYLFKQRIKAGGMDRSLILLDMIKCLREDKTDVKHLIHSDSWQIERKTMVWEGEVEWFSSKIENVEIFYIDSRKAPSLNDILGELFAGKRTKIRIEEIMEKER